VISRSEVDALSSGQPVRFLVVGQVLGPSGVSGDLRVEPQTDFPDRFAHLTQIHVGENLRPYPIDSVRIDGKAVVLKLRGIDDANTAQALRNADLSIPIDQAIELPPDSYYWHQIIGLEVWTDEGRLLGSVTEVLRTGSNDVYVVRAGPRELLLPAIEDVVLSVDITRRRLLVHLLPGIE
jgi:16S rRNA processing protein RimM